MTITKTQQKFIDGVESFMDGSQFRDLASEGAAFSATALKQALILYMQEQETIKKQQRKAERAAKKALEETGGTSKENFSGDDGEVSESEAPSSAKKDQDGAKAKSDVKPKTKGNGKKKEKSNGSDEDSDYHHCEADGSHIDETTHADTSTKAKAKPKLKLAKKAKTDLIPEMLNLSGEDDEEAEEQLYYVRKHTDENWEVFDDKEGKNRVCKFNPEDGSIE